MSYLSLLIGIGMCVGGFLFWKKLQKMEEKKGAQTNEVPQDNAPLHQGGTLPPQRPRMPGPAAPPTQQAPTAQPATASKPTMPAAMRRPEVKESDLTDDDMDLFAPDAMHGSWLKVVQGPDKGKTYFLARGDQVLSVGRAPNCQIQLSDPEVSRLHCTFRFTQAGWELADLASTTGTFIREERVKHYPLQDRDQIQLGGTVLLYQKDAAYEEDNIAEVKAQETAFHAGTEIPDLVGEEQPDGQLSLTGRLQEIGKLLKLKKAETGRLKFLEGVSWSILRTLDADRAIYMKLAEGGRWTKEASHHRPGIAPDRLRTPPFKAVMAAAIKESKEQIQPAKSGLAGALAVPVVSDAGVDMVIYVDRLSPRPNDFTAEHLDFLKSVTEVF